MKENRMLKAWALGLAACGFLLGFTGTAQAGEIDPGNSTMSLRLSALPAVTVAALPGTELLVTMGDGSILGPATGHFIAAATSVWSTVNFGPGTALFTGVPLISNLKVTMANQAGVLQDGFTTPQNKMSGSGLLVGPTLGGHLRLSGVSVIHAAGGAIQLPVPLSHVGGLMGETTMATLIGNNITVTNGPFVTAAIKITSVTSNIITVPTRPLATPPNIYGGSGVVGIGFTLQLTPDEDGMTPSTNGGYLSTGEVGLAYENHTVTISGTNQLASGSKAGSVTVVAPMRIDTGPGIAGRIPGDVVISFAFVPEPGTMLLLVSGAVGLALIGRRRMRK
jgi:hypothetical protein